MGEDFVKARLGDAWSFLEAAKKEFLESRGDPVRVRDAAEKAWNAVVQATDALIYAFTGARPLSHYERRVALRDIERRFEGAKRLGLRDRYMARALLYGETFYVGVGDLEEVKTELEKVEEYIRDVERLLKEAR
ncbi:MAG: PaREP1 family protein [Thermofilum sp.]|nr:PaREP1 family protein [Thermofilum sp.]